MQHMMRRITVITFIMNGEKLAHVWLYGRVRVDRVR